nr:WxL domain-containing protein [Paenibacillus bovis]
MNRFKKYAVRVVAFGLVVGAFATSSFASSTAITGGTIEKTEPNIGDFSEVKLDGTIQTSEANFGTFTVTDARGSGAGWDIYVEATQFTTGELEGAKTLPLNSLTLKKAEVTPQAGSSDISTFTISDSSTIDNGTGGYKILSANQNGGMGKFDISFPEKALVLTLNPKDVKAGTYTSTITVNFNAGP